VVRWFVLKNQDVSEVARLIKFKSCDDNSWWIFTQCSPRNSNASKSIWKAKRQPWKITASSSVTFVASHQYELAHKSSQMQWVIEPKKRVCSPRHLSRSFRQARCIDKGTSSETVTSGFFSPVPVVADQSTLWKPPPCALFRTPASPPGVHRVMRG